MSRHLFVGADVAGNAKLATGLMADGAIGIEAAGKAFDAADVELDADLYVAGNNVPADADQIRILLGTGELERLLLNLVELMHVDLLFQALEFSIKFLEAF